MPIHAYKAMDATGRIVRGRMDAINAADLDVRLKRMGLDFIDGAPLRRRTPWYGAVGRRDLIHFCFHLEQLCAAGVPILDALVDLRDSVEAPRWREVLADLVESIAGGKTLSHALAAHPRIFDEVMVSLIRAGEDSGRLPEILGDLVASLKWRDEIAAQARRLAIYPAFLGALLLGVVFFLMIYLVPRMVGFMKAMGHALPLHTEILIAVSGFLVDHWLPVLALPAASAAALHVAIRRRPRVRHLVDRAKLGVPLAGDILRKIILARFAGTFATMYGAGISILDAIRATEKVVGNVVVAEGLQRVGRMISEGENVAAAFQNAGLFPPLVIRMLRVGESTGALDRALLNVGYFYDRDVRESVARLQVLMEPAITVVIGIVMGWIMLSVLGPIYDMIAGIRI